MALNAKNAPGGGGSFEPLEAGTYPARLVMVVDLGLQTRSYQGEEKDPHPHIALTYEFLDEFLKDEDGNEMEDKPLWRTEMMPIYNLDSEKAKSTSRYFTFDPNVKDDGDWTAQLGKPCLITIIQNPGKGKHQGKVFDKITAVSAMRDKDAKKAPPLVNEARFFDLDDPDYEVFKGLPKFLKERITNNLEFSGSLLEKLLEKVGYDEDSEPPKENEEAKEDDDDESPF